MEPSFIDRRDFLKVAGVAGALSTFSSCERKDAVSVAANDRPAVASELCFMSAVDLAALIQLRKASAREVMAAHLDRISRVNPKVNAIVSKLEDEQCLALADAADARSMKGESLPPLHGLPMAIKDLQPAVGFRYTRGSLAYKDEMPTQDSLLVERLRNGGVIPIGKTNVPEFGMGSHTYNKVYGATFNPYDLTKSAGGSSGGAAAALAAGMLPVADGSDFGGSLRNPGNFNNIVGMRPSVGLVPSAPNPFPFLGFVVLGPMARSVADTALLLSVIAGADARDPGSYPSDPVRFRGNLQRSFRGVRVAWCPDLGGLPLDRRVEAVLVEQRKTFEALGCIVEEAAPDLSGADDIFRTIRDFRSASVWGGVVKANRSLIKPEAVREVEEGQKLSAGDVSRAMTAHSQLLDRVRRFQEKYEYILCAVNQVPPFDASLDWPKAIEGVAMTSYLDWMKSACWITVTFRPAISVPAGFTPEGLPVGLQIVGRFREDLAVLQLAHAFEQATGVGKKRPSL